MCHAQIIFHMEVLSNSQRHKIQESYLSYNDDSDVRKNK